MQDVRDSKLFSGISTIGGGLLILLAIGFIGYFSLQRTGFFLDKQNKDKNHVASLVYYCENNKTLKVDFFDKKDEVASTTEEEIDTSNLNPNIPTGNVVIMLDDRRNFELNQKVSAEGARYSNKDESFVFLDKGEDILILEFDTEKYYKNCKKTPDLIKEDSTSTASTTEIYINN